jgi:phage FluMu protein Com
MEVRCEKCNKLFRVADDKITGTGIKFACTRCGAYVRITHEDFEQYTRSRGAVSVLNLSEPRPEPSAAAPLSPEAAEPFAMETAPSGQESPAFDLASQATHENAQEGNAPLFVEPDSLAPVSAEKPEPAVELKTEPLMQEKPITEPPVESQPEPKPEPLFVPRERAKTTPEKETLPEPAESTPPVSTSPETSIQRAVPKKEYDRSTIPPASPASDRIVKGPIPSSTSSRSGRMFGVLIGTLIILGLAGYGVFVYLQPSPQKVNESVNEMISIEGLQIVNPVGSVETNGDLLVSAAIENATEKEKTAWYVVLEVYDAQGAVLSKIRLLNGNQIYSQRDYDILAQRGVNAQELKAKILSGKGTVIPPKGRANFEARYLQPPPGIASFVAQALPFDPVQLRKEIAEEIK